MEDEETRVVMRAVSESDPASPDSIASDMTDMDVFGGSVSPTSLGFIRRVKRRFSLRTSRRKLSNASLSSLNLELTYSQLYESKDMTYDRDSWQLGEEREHLYQGLLSSVIHPLGAAEHTVGLRPGDLVDHLKEVFDLERGEHEFFVRRVLANKPKHVQLNVSLLEARLRPNDVKTVKDPYCILSIVNPYKNPRSPKSSPKNSPRSSRKKTSNPPSIECGEVKQSQLGKGGPNPSWNESFEIDVGEITSDELHIYIWNNGLGDAASTSDQQPPTNFHRSSSLRKSFFRQIRHMVEHEKTNTDFLGGIVLPLKDISVTGCEKWFDVIEKCRISGKTKLSGKIYLALSQSIKEATDCESCDDINSPNTPCIDIYYQALKQVLQHAAKITQAANVGVIDGNLSDTSSKTLQLYAVSHKISKLSQSMLYLIVLLEWSCKDDANIADTALIKAIDQLHMTWLSMQRAGENNFVQKMPLTDSEIVMFRRAVTQYADSIMKHIDQVVFLFPPSVDVISSLNSNVGILVQLLQLDLWDDNTSPLQQITRACIEKLQKDTTTWISTEIDRMSDDVGECDCVIMEMSLLSELVDSMVSHSTPLGCVKHFFNNLNINYYKITSIIVDCKISWAAQGLIHELNKYQVRYHKYSVNINKSSRSSLALYFSLRKLYLAISSNSTSPREIFKLSLANYQSWFQEVLVFWLQTFKTECLFRMDKALEIDKDVVSVTTSAKYSTSAVDVLACFNRITDEWRQIEYNDADSVLMGVTKITDLICDGARFYADRIHSILERNCYYDECGGKEENNRFDVTYRLCITLNNIEKVRRYMNELPTLLSWDAVHVAVSSKHGGEIVGQHALKTLHRLTKSAHCDILLKSTVLVKEITERMKENIFKYMEQFTRINPDKLSSIDAVLDYLSSNTETLTKRLVASIYPVFMENLWFTVLVILDEQLMSGQSPEYYETMKRHLRSLSMYFVRGGMAEEKLNSALCLMIGQRLQLNATPTSELILRYYNELAEQCATPVDYYGDVAMNVAYLEETRGNVTIFVKIIRANNLPGLDMGGLSDPYVVVTLQPEHLFGSYESCRTNTINKTLNPVFNNTFQFPNIPKEMLSQSGAVFHVCVMDHDNFGSDDFAGEAFISLKEIEAIEIHNSVDSLPVKIRPIKHPVNQSGPFQILRDRIHWDKLAKRVVTERLKLIDNRTERTDTPAKSTTFLSFIGGLFR